MIIRLHDEHGEVGVNGEYIVTLIPVGSFDQQDRKTKPWSQCCVVIERGGCMLYVRETMDEVMVMLDSGA